MFDRPNDHTESEVALFVLISKRTIQRISARDDLSPVAMKHDFKTMVRKKILTQRDQKQMSRLVDKNRLQIRQELLQSVNEGPS